MHLRQIARQCQLAEPRQHPVFDFAAQCAAAQQHRIRTQAVRLRPIDQHADRSVVAEPVCDLDHQAAGTGLAELGEFGF